MINATQRNATQRNATQRNATQRNATQRNATQRNATQRNATQRNATQRNATHKHNPFSIYFFIINKPAEHLTLCGLIAFASILVCVTLQSKFIDNKRNNDSV